MIALIPARGGSKGIPNKNIRDVAGLPLIAHTIEAARSAQNIHRVLVSTDSEEIRKVAETYGAEVPFLRPKELAQDDSLAIDAYKHAVDQLKKAGENVESFCVLQATSPLRTARDIDQAIELFHTKKADSVISVSQAAQPITWYRKMDSQGVLTPYFGAGEKPTNRQEEETLYIPNGAIYVLRSEFIFTNKSYYSPKTYGYVMPRERSIDIDEPIDLQIAEMLLTSSVR